MPDKQPLLQLIDISKRYRQNGARKRDNALSHVTLDINRGEILGLVGESGAGKSTLAKCILCLEKPDKGRIRFKDVDMTNAKPRDLKNIRRRIQIIWQDPYTYLNPYMLVHDLIREPLENFTINTKRQNDVQVDELMRQVGLDPGLGEKRPHELSGGECQRVAIARALAPGPDLVVCDEPLSSLDTPRQVHILHLLRRLQQEMNLTYLFITHDLAVVRNFCHRVAVIRQGRIVEQGSCERIFSSPEHPYTNELISSMLLLSVCS